jgi:hypothetical protein
MSADTPADENHTDATAQTDAPIEQSHGVPADLGASATMEFDSVDATGEAVRTRVLTSDDDAVAVELGLDLGAVTCEVVLDADATAALAARLTKCHDALDE